MDNSDPTSEYDYFSVTYRFTPPEGISPEAIAQSIAEEQTVEIPHKCIPETLFEDSIVGTVEDITSPEKDCYDTTIQYRSDLTNNTIPQLLNILFGTLSPKMPLQITGLSFSDQFLSQIPGPAFGIEGIRKRLGVSCRPLLCTALKPIGISNTELASIAGACALGGIDIITDGHRVTDQPFHRFDDRINRVTEAITQANLHNGSTTLYFPNLCGTLNQIDRQAEHLIKFGIPGVLVAPHIVGLDIPRYLAEKYNYMIITYPAFSNMFYSAEEFGILPHLHLGTLFRMLGADISMFPSWGKFCCFTREQCLSIAHTLTKPTASLAPSFPGPCGGITIDQLPDMATAYGENSVLHIAIPVLNHSADYLPVIRSFIDTVYNAFPEAQETPQAPFFSSCPYPSTQTHEPPPDRLTCNSYTWSDRIAAPYYTLGQNTERESPECTGITVTELVQNSNSYTRFGLRYFELEKGNNFSIDTAEHNLIIIGVRGSGILVKNNNQYTLNPHDIGYVGAMEPHQLHNSSSTEPFGFFCIAGNKKDKPNPVVQETIP